MFSSRWGPSPSPIPEEREEDCRRENEVADGLGPRMRPRERSGEHHPEGDDDERREPVVHPQRDPDRRRRVQHVTGDVPDGREEEVRYRRGDEHRGELGDETSPPADPPRPPDQEQTDAEADASGDVRPAGDRSEQSGTPA